MNHSTSHEKDFYRWTESQCSILKKKEFSNLDIENLIEEIESLGISMKRALESYLAILFLHLLKIEFQPKKRTRSWDLSIIHAKHKINLILKENPSLKPHLKEISKEAYFTARLQASSETDLDQKVFPDTYRWSLQEILKEK